MPLQMFSSPLESKKNSTISLRIMFINHQTWVTCIKIHSQLLQSFGNGTVKRKKWVNMGNHLSILMYSLAKYEKN